MSDPVAPPAAPPEAPPPAGPPAAPPETPPATPPEDVASLPEWAQKLIKDTRGEAATYRTKAKDVESAQQAQLDALAKALGLKPSDDPAAAAKTAAEERDAARKLAQDATTTLAVYRMAAKAGANAESLTDSRSFMAQLDALDPTAADFAAQVETAIGAAMEANPALKLTAAAPAPPVRSGGPVGGGAPVPGQWTEADLAGKSAAEIVKAQADGLLGNILKRQVEDAE